MQRAANPATIQYACTKSDDLVNPRMNPFLKNYFLQATTPITIEMCVQWHAWLFWNEWTFITVESVWYDLWWLMASRLVSKAGRDLVSEYDVSDSCLPTRPSCLRRCVTESVKRTFCWNRGWQDEFTSLNPGDISIKPEQHIQVSLRI